MSTFKALIRKIYYPVTVWVLTCILSPLLFDAIFEMFLKKNVVVNDSITMLTVWPMVIPISFILSIPGFILFFVGYHFSYKSQLKMEWVKIILLGVNLFNIIVTFASCGKGSIWTVWFPLSILIISSLLIAFLPVLRNKKNEKENAITI